MGVRCSHVVWWSGCCFVGAHVCVLLMGCMPHCGVCVLVVWLFGVWWCAWCWCVGVGGVAWGSHLCGEVVLVCWWFVA